MSATEAVVDLCSGADCVTVEDAGDGAVYLSTTRRLDVVLVDADEWATFLAKVKAGEFDPPGAG